MNDSYDVAISVFCLCCNRLYMRKVKGSLGPEREACPMCSEEIQSLFRNTAKRIVGLWVPVNRLGPYG